MATYSQQDKERLLSIPVAAVLEHFGRRTDHHGAMYFSPFRDEASPSMHIDARLNLWNDFGESRGGNVLQMVSLLSGEPMHRSWDILAGIDPSVAGGQESIPAARTASSQLIVIDSVLTRFSSRRLVGYAFSRGIPQRLLERYCFEIGYHTSGRPDAHCYAIGFPAGDGWVLRGAYDGYGAKRCTASRPSFISSSGQCSSLPFSRRVEVFEGFFDFLSWMQMNGRTVPGCDVCVLNSVSNLSRAMQYIGQHASVSCWLDADDAGRRAYAGILAACPGAVSHEADLQGCKDLNERLVRLKESKAKDNTTSVSTKSTLKI